MSIGTIGTFCRSSLRPRNVSHSARGGVDNHYDAPAARGANPALRARDLIEYAQPHDRRRPRQPPVLSQRGLAGPAAHVQAFNQHPAGATSTRPHNSNVREQSARQADACHAACFASQFVRPTASRPRTRASNPTPVEPRTSPERFVRARLRCSSRASLPLTPRLAGVAGSSTRPALPASLPP